MFGMFDLPAFLERIGHSATVRPDVETLRAVHRAFAFAVPYESFDVQFGAGISRDPAKAFDKIVTRRRGGWCYEMNGLLGVALEAIGFRVRGLAGAVHRERQGDKVIGNHLVLLVDLDQGTWLADMGFGDGLIEAVPLREGAFDNGFYRCSLERAAGGWWRYRNDPRGGTLSFDFHEDVAEEVLLEAQCRYLQSDPESGFVLNAVTQRWTPDALLMLRGKVLKTIKATHETTRTLASAEDLVATLKTSFALDLPEAASLWPRIVARHQVLGLP
jgi:N-hydroxyarylamine O-acetyltransferase